MTVEELSHLSLRTTNCIVTGMPARLWGGHILASALAGRDASGSMRGTTVSIIAGFKDKATKESAAHDGSCYGNWKPCDGIEDNFLDDDESASSLRRAIEIKDAALSAKDAQIAKLKAVAEAAKAGLPVFDACCPINEDDVTYGDQERAIANLMTALAEQEPTDALYAPVPPSDTSGERVAETAEVEHDPIAAELWEMLAVERRKVAELERMHAETMEVNGRQIESMAAQVAMLTKERDELLATCERVNNAKRLAESKLTAAQQRAEAAEAPTPEQP